MPTQDDPVAIHYTGLDLLWRNIVFWGAAGAICLIVSPVPFVTLVLVIAGGFAVGCICAVWVYRMEISRIDPTRLAGVVLMIAATAGSGSVHKALGYLALGSFFSASISVALKIFGAMALKKLNQKHSRFLQATYGTKPAPPPPEKDARATRDAFLSVLPQPLRDEMAASFVPVTVIGADSPSEQIASDSSSFGGLPLLSPGETWPARDGRPMAFLAQINLAEVAALLPEGSPKTGQLSFFYDHEQPWGFDPEDLGSGCVLYNPEPRICLPPERVTNSAPRQGLHFRREIAQNMSDDLDERFFTCFRSLEGDAKLLLEILHDRVRELEPGENRLFSAPSPVQNQMDAELRTAATAYGLPTDTAWAMILQLGSVDEQDWCWGDAGCIYFWLPQMDLVAKRFDRPWVVLQCT